MKLRYMIIGAGGVGGPVGAYLSKSGADTTLIARGKHLAVLQEHGLTLVSGENERESIPVKAIDMDGFLAAREQGAPAPDVIFVCVKGYSLADTVPFIRKAAGKDTVVIPVLNIYGTGRTLQAELPELLVTDGCIYISANRIAPGVIQKHGAICRIVYGLPSHKTDHPVLQQVETDLKTPGSTRFILPMSSATRCSNLHMCHRMRPADSIITQKLRKCSIRARCATALYA